jgi:hypothetical protein
VLPPTFSVSNIPSIFSIFQVSEENLYKFEDKLLLHKSIPFTALDKMPMHRVNGILDSWLEEIERQKKEQKKQESENKRQQNSSKNFQSPKFPKAPKF